MNCVKLKATDFDGFLNNEDNQNLHKMNQMMEQANSIFKSYPLNKLDDKLIQIYNILLLTFFF